MRTFIFQSTIPSSPSPFYYGFECVSSKLSGSFAIPEWAMRLVNSNFRNAYLVNPSLQIASPSIDLFWMMALLFLLSLLIVRKGERESVKIRGRCHKRSMVFHIQLPRPAKASILSTHGNEIERTRNDPAISLTLTISHFILTYNEPARGSVAWITKGYFFGCISDAKLRGWRMGKVWIQNMKFREDEEWGKFEFKIWNFCQAPILSVKSSFLNVAVLLNFW